MRDWITLGISILALLLSATTAYFANFLEVDDLRVVASPDPTNFPYPFGGKNATLLPGTWQVVFINNGTRPIAVVNLLGSIGDAPGEFNKQCGHKVFLSTDTPGFVVREKQIVREKVALMPHENKSGGIYVNSDHNVQFPSGSQGIEGNLCLSAQLATVSKAYVDAGINLLHFKFNPNGIDYRLAGVKSPQVIWHSKKSIFQSD